MGGYIDVDSQIGVGTTLSLYLPATEEGLQEIEKEDGQIHSGRGRILVMDDQERILMLVEKMLKRLGYEVCTVKDGVEAIASYKQALNSGTPFDVVILDLTVPGGMGGALALPELLNLNPRVKAIVSSGYGNDPVMASYRDYGFCGVIPKPYTSKQLSDALEQLDGL